MRSPDPADWARGTRFLWVWCLPAALLLLSVQIGGRLPVVVWPTALAWMGGACLLNAQRCHRLHCYLTGPYFLLLAVVSLLFGLGVLPLGRHGWSVLSLAVVVGGPVLIYVPERLFGHYRSGDHC